MSENLVRLRDLPAGTYFMDAEGTPFRIRGPFTTSPAEVVADYLKGK